jgi:DNA-binding PadR family transcriptional regulator
MGTFQKGRHAQSFILICLVDGPAYGLELQRRIEKMTHGDIIDRAFLYRSLNKLAEEGRVSVRLDDSQRGAVRKYYSLTESGYDLLHDFQQDICHRVINLNAFLEKYEQMKQKKMEER